MLAAAALLMLSYLCGSIPTGVLLSARRGVDPRDIGSGNIGATNVARTAGPTLGLLTLIGDAAKGLAPVLLAVWLGFGEPTVALAGMAAFCGHLYSCFLRFHGGKGVATAGGVLLGLAPAAMALIVPTFVLIVAVSRYVSLASMATAVATVPILFALGYSAAIVATGALMSALIVVRHRDNIQRIRFGTESRVGASRPRAGDSEVA
jgi:glycerol-3-phosphate acyltransferase PlsY